MIMSKTAGLSISLIITILLSACSLTGDITPPPGAELPPPQQTSQTVLSSSLYPILPPNITNGAKIYTQECSQCHGVSGLGDGPQAADLAVPAASLGLSDLAIQYSPAQWYTVVTQGTVEKFMPAFANLTDRQRWDVVAYAMSLSAPNDMVNQGKALYQQHCMSCHGKTGKGNGPDSKSLTTPPTDFTDQATMAQISSYSLDQAITLGVSPDMPAFTNTLNAAERLAVVAYLRSLTYTAIPSETGAYPAPTSKASGVASINPYPAPLAYPSPVVTQTPGVAITDVVTTTATFTGSVTVQLINGTGGDPPSAAPVTLYAFDNMQNTYSETLSTGVNGVYTFTNVTMPQGRAFLATTDYSLGTYGSDIAVVDPTTPNLNLQIKVYDPTTDISVLTTDRLHILFDFSQLPNVTIVEMFIISNPSNQAVVASTENGPVVTFPLPAGYTNLAFEDGELGSRFIETSQGFADKMTVSPGQGQYTVIFNYQLPYDHKLNFVQPIILPTSAVVVIVPDNGVKIDSDQLQDVGTRDISGSSYHTYTGGSLIAGSSLEFTISGTPRNESSSTSKTGALRNLAIGLGVFGVALVIGGLWLFRKNQMKTALQASPDTLDIASPYYRLDASPESEDTLMDAIIALDDQYHAGNLPKEAYLERRAILKEKLRNLSQG